ncbi:MULTISPECIES: hypothetical protein [Bacillaceae]|uniref:hypothetical protein n=1 Tax=Bacillaceae TaxID=186817 RepID=UPI00046FB74A|nr:hypothetical protein [Heyndrickxia ginsengihumi]
MAKSEQIGVITYSPLGAGLLTGKCGVNKRPDHGRIVDDARYHDRYSAKEDFVVADQFTKYA